ncbi:MAG: glutamate-5-semialdehyde dehydrogenase [Lachnospiraceae bacterium]|nr:glutamate-5-semialdehyde dehydrogenase [Lachnospiraceae bacterium]
MRSVEEICKSAKEAKYSLGILGTDEKNAIILSCADELLKKADAIVSANAVDMKNADEKGISPAMKDRLLLTKERIAGIASGMRQVAALPDPIGEMIAMWTRPNGLQIGQKRVPMGVIGVIYEARPNVTADVFSLCLKTGNVTILKGGSDAIHSNKAMTDIFREVLKGKGYNENYVTLIEDTDRAATTEFMKQDAYVDLLIPRGSAGLIQSVKTNATIPVIETGTGNCHIYVDESADFDMALSIIENAKTQRIGVCNAMESLVVHQRIAADFLPLLEERLKKYDLHYFADEKAIDDFKEKDVMPATDCDFGTEYLDYKMSVKTVSNIDEAIAHINRYNTGHSEAIITESYANAQKFLNEVDAACVYVNASTRFTDGGEFGFGAEIGISTQKLHARGPMGLKALTSTKYIIFGNGQVRP